MPQSRSRRGKLPWSLCGLALQGTASCPPSATFRASLLWQSSHGRVFREHLNGKSPISDTSGRALPSNRGRQQPKNFTLQGGGGEAVEQCARDTGGVLPGNDRHNTWPAVSMAVVQRCQQEASECLGRLQVAGHPDGGQGHSELTQLQFSLHGSVLLTFAQLHHWKCFLGCAPCLV